MPILCSPSFIFSALKLEKAGAKMFYSHQLLAQKPPLGLIW
ncbi:hypothetical protein SLEP1_g46678 [Rubroshorea leprosula]|uniref:Uncharacterized protein n=1 Tax=Rubroshorea leprosula TaxID=152421 RepID=A0AAV5LNR0_9ROSI|nr:hypothetical protein SLEP1_g46678 [Rubroshorea leprosula]